MMTASATPNMIHENSGDQNEIMIATSPTKINSMLNIIVSPDFIRCFLTHGKPKTALMCFLNEPLKAFFK